MVLRQSKFIKISFLFYSPDLKTDLLGKANERLATPLDALSLYPVVTHLVNITLHR